MKMKNINLVGATAVKAYGHSKDGFITVYHDMTDDESAIIRTYGEYYGNKSF